MFYEYAIEPKLLSNWRDFRYYYDQMGACKGKFISRYPKQWKKLVYESLGECGDLEKMRIVERLSGIDHKLLPRNNEWDANKDWLTNAEAEHDKSPFHAIIARINLNNHERVLVGDTLNNEVDLWRASTVSGIPRCAKDMANSIALLLQASREIIFIDPYFDPESSRFRKPLIEFLKTAKLNRTSEITRVEYHLKEIHGHHYFNENCNKLTTEIPAPINITFRRWTQKPRSEKLHDRYIVTEKGGVQFSVGLDQANSGETTNISILSEDLHSSVWNKYLSNEPAFKFIDECTVIGEHNP